MFRMRPPRVTWLFGDDVRADASRCDTFPPQPRLLPGFLLPALFRVPARQRSLGRPCFSDFSHKAARPERQASDLRGRKGRRMQSSLRSGGRESAETVPERGDGELEQRAKLPSSTRRYLSDNI